VWISRRATDYAAPPLSGLGGAAAVWQNAGMAKRKALSAAVALASALAGCATDGGAAARILSVQVEKWWAAKCNHLLTPAEAGTTYPEHMAAASRHNRICLSPPISNRLQNQTHW
jgi:hypothetical protein